MAARIKEVNPFYVLSLLLGTAFVFTCLGYLVAPSIVQNAANPRPGGNAPGAGSIALAHWFDRWGPLALGIEVGALILFGCVAMLVDPWFDKSEPKSPSN